MRRTKASVVAPKRCVYIFSDKDRQPATSLRRNIGIVGFCKTRIRGMWTFDFNQSKRHEYQAIAIKVTRYNNEHNKRWSLQTQTNTGLLLRRPLLGFLVKPKDNVDLKLFTNCYMRKSTFIYERFLQCVMLLF